MMGSGFHNYLFEYKLALRKEMDRNLAVVYILKDDLRKLWEYRCPKAAAKHLARWCGWAAVSGIEAVRKFGRSPMRAEEEVLNFCRHRITTGRLEGFNNIVSRIVHRARGIRSLDYPSIKLPQESLEAAPAEVKKSPIFQPEPEADTLREVQGAGKPRAT